MRDRPDDCERCIVGRLIDRSDRRSANPRNRISGDRRRSRSLLVCPSICAVGANEVGPTSDTTRRNRNILYVRNLRRGDCALATSGTRSFRALWSWTFKPGDRHIVCKCGIPIYNVPGKKCHSILLLTLPNTEPIFNIL